MNASRLILAFVAVFHFPFVNLASADEYLIVGNQGQLTYFDGTTLQLMRAAPFYKNQITDALVDNDSTLTLYVAAAGLYFIQPFSPKPTYIQVKEAGFQNAIRMDVQSGRPAFDIKPKNLPGKLMMLNKSKKLEDAPKGSRIAFTEVRSYSRLVPNSRLTTDEFSDKFPNAKGIVSLSPKAEWIMCGQSRDLTIYAKVYMDAVSKEKPYHNTYLIYDREHDKWTAFPSDEHLGCHVYEGIAVFKGEQFVPKSSRLETAPTGNYYVFTVGAQAAIKLTLNPDFTIYYATPKGILLGKDKDVYVISRDSSKWGSPMKLFQAEFYPFKVWPISK